MDRKRGAGASDAERSTLEELLESTVSEMRENHKKMSDYLHDAVRTAEERQSTTTGNLLRKVDELNQQRFGSIERAHQHLDERVSVAEKAIAALRGDNEKLSQSVATAVVGEPTQVLADDAFAREIDHSLIRANTANMVTKEALALVVASWLGDAGIKHGEFFVNGPVVGKLFSVRIKGSGGLGARRTRKPRNVAIERATKALHKHLSELHRGKDFYPKKREGIITSSFVPLVRVDATAPTQFKVEWNNALALELGVDRSLAKECVDKSCLRLGGSDITWSS